MRLQPLHGRCIRIGITFYGQFTFALANLLEQLLGQANHSPSDGNREQADRGAHLPQNGL